jgi:serine/threonine-protein kinase RsbW
MTMFGIVENVTKLGPILPMPTTLHATADARQDCIRPLRDVAETVARDLGLSDMQVSAVKLCVSEAVTNVVKHAYPETAPGPVDMSVREVGDELEVVVADRGHGTGAGREHSDRSGFGLAVVSRMTSRCTFTAASGGTTVEMLFPLRPRTSRHDRDSSWAASPFLRLRRAAGA